MMFMVAAFVIIQLAYSFALNRSVVQGMRARVNVAEQRMREDGAPLAENRHLLSALESMTNNVASYVVSVTNFVIIINGAMFLTLLINRRREDSSS